LDNGKCCNIKSFQDDLLSKTVWLDNLLNSLRDNYGAVKTKRQLQLEVPAGFRQMNHHTKDLLSHLRSLHAELDSSFASSDPPQELMTLMSKLDMSSNMDLPMEQPTTQSPSPTAYVSIIRSVDKPSSTLPHNITVSEDFMRASMGFRRLETAKKKIPKGFIL
jgi:hypothetical protein